MIFPGRSYAEDLAEEEEVFEAKVNKNKLETGAIFSYIIKIKGEFYNPKMDLPEFKDFIVVSQVQSQRYLSQDKNINFELTLT